MNSLPDDATGPAKDDKQTRLNFYSQSFQLRYGIWLSTIGVFCFLVMGFLIYLTILRTIQSSGQPELVRELVQRLLSPTAIFLNYEVVLPALILLAFLIAIGIVGTHRIAGPLFAMNRHMNRVRTGHARAPLVLRRGDELQDIVNSMNAMLMTFWEHERQAASELKAISALLDQGATQKAGEKLRALITRLESTEPTK